MTGGLSKACTGQSLKTFDKSKLDQEVHCLAVIVPCAAISGVTKACRHFLLRGRTQRNVISTPCCGSNEKAILFDPSKAPNWDALADTLGSQDSSAFQVLNTAMLRAIDVSYTKGYDELTVSEALRGLLPETIEEYPISFESVGHIAHVNLRDEHLSYKSIIGQVILDKNPAIETVVNKSNMISNQFRTFPMEVIAGRESFDVEVVEHGVRFKFDFSKVYWNSRLGTEHSRLVDRFSPGDVVLDAFCGVGPFAIPAAIKGCIVYANDLNPESYKSLIDNVKLNKVEPNVSCFNEDARKFIRKIIRENSNPVSHIVMNLPASAISFLDVFAGIFPRSIYNDREEAHENEGNGSDRPDKRRRTSASSGSSDLPIIHCYCFAAVGENERDIVARAEKVIGTAHRIENWEVRRVRSVAPNKEMYCLHFRMPSRIAFEPIR